MILPPSQNTVGPSNKITLLILYYVISRLVTLLKVTDGPLQVSIFFYLNLSFKCINFLLSLFLLFILEVSVSFTSSNVYVSYIALIWIL